MACYTVTITTHPRGDRRCDGERVEGADPPRRVLCKLALRGERLPYRYRGVRIELALVRTPRENASEEAFHGRRARPIQRQSLVFARRDEHRDLYLHAVLSVPAVQERRDQRLVVSNHVGRDGCGDVLIRVCVPLLLCCLARQPDRRCRAGSVLPARRSLLAARLHPPVPGPQPDPLLGRASGRRVCMVRAMAGLFGLRHPLLPQSPDRAETLTSRRSMHVVTPHRALPAWSTMRAARRWRPRGATTQGDAPCPRYRKSPIRSYWFMAFG